MIARRGALVNLLRRECGRNLDRRPRGLIVSRGMPWVWRFVFSAPCGHDPAGAGWPSRTPAILPEWRDALRRVRPLLAMPCSRAFLLAHNSHIVPDYRRRAPPCQSKTIRRAGCGVGVRRTLGKGTSLLYICPSFRSPRRGLKKSRGPAESTLAARVNMGATTRLLRRPAPAGLLAMTPKPFHYLRARQ